MCIISTLRTRMNHRNATYTTPTSLQYSGGNPHSSQLPETHRACLIITTPTQHNMQRRRTTARHVTPPRRDDRIFATKHRGMPPTQQHTAATINHCNDNPQHNSSTIPTISTTSHHHTHQSTSAGSRINPHAVLKSRRSAR